MQKYPQWHCFALDSGPGADVPIWARQVIAVVERRRQEIESLSGLTEGMPKLREILYEELIPLGWQARLELVDPIVHDQPFLDAGTPGWRPELADLIRSDCSAILLLLERFDFQGRFASLFEIAEEFRIRSLILGVPVEDKYGRRSFEKAKDAFATFHRKGMFPFETLLVIGW
jgi:hypothetical protein